MKKTVSMIILLVNIFVLSVACCIFLSACNDKNTVTLNGFSVDENIEVAYGSIYEIPDLIVTDNSGNVYSVETTVTANGEPVDVVAGKFNVNQFYDYVITFSVKVSENDVRSITTTLKVKDLTAPVISISDIETLYTVGDSVTLPKISVTDDVDVDVNYTIKVMFGNSEVNVDKEKNSFEAKEVGTYSIIVEAQDGENNASQESIDVYARSSVKKGEIEAFSDEYSALTVTPIQHGGVNELLSGYTTDSVGGYKGNGGLYWFSSRYKMMNNLADYPGIILAPRPTKDELVAMKNEGYDQVTVTAYLDAENVHGVYQRWEMKEGESVQSTAIGLQPNTWTTFGWDLQLFIDRYDDITAGTEYFLYLANDVYYGQEEFTLYIESIYVTRERDISFDSGFLDESVTMGDTIDLTKMCIDNIDEADIIYSIKTPAGKEIVSGQETSYEISDFGQYEFSAMLTSGIFRGETTKTITVFSSFAYVSAIKESLTSITDKNSEEFYTKFLQILDGYQSLKTEDQTKFEETLEEKSFTDWLFTISGVESVDDKLIYFDNIFGLSQVKLQETYTGATETPSDLDNSEVQFTAAGIGGKEDCTVITVRNGVQPVYSVSLQFTNIPDQLGSISEYESIKFEVYIANTDKVSGVRASTAATTNGNHMKYQKLDIQPNCWTSVSIPLNGFSAWDEVYLNFFDAGWVSFTDGTAIYISAITATPYDSVVPFESESEFSTTSGDAALITLQDNLGGYKDSEADVSLGKTPVDGVSNYLCISTKTPTNVHRINFTENIELAFEDYEAVVFKIYIASGNVGSIQANNVANATVLPEQKLSKETWQTITVPLSENVTGWSDLNLRIVGEGWNPMNTGTTIYISNIQAIRAD